MSTQILRHIPEQEYQWPRVNGEEVRETIRDRGSLVIRQAIDSTKVALYRDLVDKTHAIYSRKCTEHGADVAQATAAQSGAVGWEGIAWALKCGQVLPGWLADCFPGRSIIELVNADAILMLLTQFFGGPCWPAPMMHTRRVHPHTKSCGSEAALPWHVDAHPHGTSRFRVNLWTPLEDCGVECPGLQTAVLSHEDSKAISGYNQKTGSFDDVTNELRGPVYAPILRAGDIFVFSHWTPHATYVTPRMNRSRTSAELRFEYDSPHFPC